MEHDRLVSVMQGILGPEGVISEREELRSYECDGLMNYRVIPELVVLPETAEHVQQVVKLCYDEGIPFVARGSGTGLSGGALPVTAVVDQMLQELKMKGRGDRDHSALLTLIEDSSGHEIGS